MATQRYISTSFWTDKWIRKLDPSERYLYMYLLTNPETNIAGVYQITIDRIAFDTGYDERTLLPMFDRFAKAGKAYFYKEEWIVIPSWPKHQRIKERDNNKKGIDAILRDLPDDVWYFLIEKGYEYKYMEDVGRPLQGASKGLARPSNYSDTDTDSDTEINSDTDLDSDTNETVARDEEDHFSEVDDTTPTRYQHSEETIYRILRYSKIMDSLPEERRLTVNIPNLGEIKDQLSYYTTKEIKQALDNYEQIVMSGEYDFKQYSSIVNFILNGGLQKFQTDADPWNKYPKKKSGPGAVEETAELEEEF